MAKRSFIPRTRESINRQMESNDERTYNGPKGVHYLNPEVKDVRLDRLRCYKKGSTVLRIWNMLDPENPHEQLLNGRLNAEGSAGLGGMSISQPVPTVAFAGLGTDASKPLLAGEDANQFSYIIGRNKISTVEGVSFWDEPYVKLYMSAKKAFDAGQFSQGRQWDNQWNKLFSGSYKALPPFNSRYFVVASMLQNGPDFDLTREHIEYTKGSKTVIKDIPREGIPYGEKAGDPLYVFEMSQSAGRRILQLCNEEKQDWSGDESVNPSAPFKFGDPCGRFNPTTGTVKGGLFFTLYNPLNLTIPTNTTFTGTPRGTEIVEYEAAISTRFQGPNGVLTPDLSAEQVQNILDKHLFFWRESPQDPANTFLLFEPSIEQRCEWIARGFQQIPNLLRFSWMSHPEYLNYDCVQSILQARTVVDMGVAPTRKPRVTQPQPEDEFEDEAEVPPRRQSTALAAPKKTAAELADEFEDVDFEDDFPPAATQQQVNPDDDEFDEESLPDEEDKFANFDDEPEFDQNQVNSLAKAKAIARSHKRVSEPPSDKKPQAPASGKKPRRSS